MNPASAQYVLICRPSPSTEARSELDIKLCPPSGAQHFKVQTVQTYLSASPPSLDHAPYPAPAEVSGIWMVAFSTVLGLYVLSAHFGVVLRFIRG